MTPDLIVIEPDRMIASEREDLLPPVPLAIEVLSSEQTVPEILRKARRYIDWGVRRVWLIEPRKQFAMSIDRENSESEPPVIGPGFDLPITQGLSLRLAALFE